MGDAPHAEGPNSHRTWATAGEPSELVGRFYGWWRGDPLPTLATVPDLSTAVSDDVPFVAAVMGSDVDAVRDRIRLGHRPWLARVEAEPVGWGWVATREAAIDELGIAIALPPEDRYVWDFVTVPSWQGRGIYTALLQAILRQEAAARYWIGHDEGNVPSARGIAKAGFSEVGAVRRVAAGHLTFVPDGDADRAGAAAALLGLPIMNP